MNSVVRMEINREEAQIIKSVEANIVHFQDSENSKRLNDILDMIGRIAALDFTIVLSPSEKNDTIDAISLGLNMLSEELNSNVIEKTKLDEVNDKLEKFAYTTAHDLRSPLHSIEGLATLLEMSLSSDKKSEVHQYISKLREITKQMKNLISGILNYSKISTKEIKKEKLDLNEIVNEIISVDGISSRAEIRIGNTLPSVLFNRSSIVQIFRNLFDNSIKYSDKEICTIVIQAKEMSDHYEVSVSDNGPGIAFENCEKIFALFTKIGSGCESESHGIGLATVRRVLETDGGKIWVESILGKGASFIFTIKKNISQNAQIL